MVTSGHQGKCKQRDTENRETSTLTGVVDVSKWLIYTFTYNYNVLSFVYELVYD